jgi:hypothetical protein
MGFRNSVCEELASRIHRASSCRHRDRHSDLQASLCAVQPQRLNGARRPLLIPSAQRPPQRTPRLARPRQLESPIAPRRRRSRTVHFPSCYLRRLLLRKHHFPRPIDTVRSYRRADFQKGELDRKANQPRGNSRCLRDAEGTTFSQAMISHSR